MSTRWVLGKYQPGSDRWEGRYVHFDGYPTAAGPVVYGLVAELGAQGVVDQVIDAHRNGWSYLESPWAGSKCYCHQGRADQQSPDDEWVTSYDPDSWCEWAYILDPDQNAVLVFKSYVTGGEGDEPFRTHWVYVDRFNLGETQPDWAQVESRGEHLAKQAKGRAQ
jgi:hypothetical protein